MQATLLLGVVALVATTSSAQAADPARGEALFEQCIACHAMNGEHGVGPSLQGVVGRRAGTIGDFRYSPAMRRSGVVWDSASLDAFLADPQAFLRGNRMPFSGVEDATDRADIAAYLARGSAP